MKRIVLTILIFYFLPACRKNDASIKMNLYFTPKTLKPLSYYPMFPGSFWTYLNQKNDSIKFFTNKTYQKHCYSKTADTVFVPFLKTPFEFSANPIYEYDVISQFGPIWTYKRTTFISESIGLKFKRGGFDERYGDKRSVFMAKEKLKLNNDSVLVIIGANSIGEPYKYIEHYTKDIGLSWRCTIDTVSKDTIERLSLVKYYINKQ